MKTTTTPMLDTPQGRRADLTEAGLMMRRARAEFQEMPGLTLSVAQASRLWGLTATESEALLGALVDDGFLVRDRRATYRRTG